MKATVLVNFSMVTFCGAVVTGFYFLLGAAVDPTGYGAFWFLGPVSATLATAAFASLFVANRLFRKGNHE